MKRYEQYCPVARALEVLSERWTLLVIRELACGEDRFNAIARGVPRMSPSLLATRLRKLQRAGLVQRHVVDGEPRYRLTEAGAELEPLIDLIGEWGARWLQELHSDGFDPAMLMLGIKRQVQPARLPARRVTVEFQFSDAQASLRRWWLVMSRFDGIDVCDVDPGWPVDAWLETEVSTLTRVWMGAIDWSVALRENMVRTTGDHAVCRSLSGWLEARPFVGVAQAAAPLPP